MVNLENVEVGDILTIRLTVESVRDIPLHSKEEMDEVKRKKEAGEPVEKFLLFKEIDDCLKTSRAEKIALLHERGE